MKANVSESLTHRFVRLQILANVVMNEFEFFLGFFHKMLSISFVDDKVAQVMFDLCLVLYCKSHAATQKTGETFSTGASIFEACLFRFSNIHQTFQFD